MLQLCARFKASTKVAAFGSHHKRGGAAFGHAASFVVSFVLALISTYRSTQQSRVSVMLHGLSVGRALDWMDGRVDGRVDDGWTSEWTDRWTDVWINSGRMDGPMGGHAGVSGKPTQKKNKVIIDLSLLQTKITQSLMTLIAYLIISRPDRNIRTGKDKFLSGKYPNHCSFKFR